MQKLLDPSLRERLGRQGYKTATQNIIPERDYLERLCGTIASLAR
jgi:hypothetical protein